MSLFGKLAKSSNYSNDVERGMAPPIISRADEFLPVPAQSRANAYVNRPRMSSKTPSKFGLSMSSPFSPNSSRGLTRGWTIPATTAVPIATVGAKPAIPEHYGRGGSGRSALTPSSNPGGFRSIISRTFHRPQIENVPSRHSPEPPSSSPGRSGTPVAFPVSEATTFERGGLAKRFLGTSSSPSDQKVRMKCRLLNDC